MPKDSILLLEIYQRYLQVTSDLITILQRNYEKAEANGENKKLADKYKEFRLHAHNTIESLNEDLHKLLKIDYELKDLEEEENNV